MKNHKNITLNVFVKYDPGDQKLPTPEAFVVAYDDDLCKIASAAVHKDCAVLQLPKTAAGKTLRIFHSTSEFDLKETSSIERLRRYQAVEYPFFIAPNLDDIRVVLPVLDLKRWLKACCRVRGEVTMRIKMPNGKVRYAPLCNARVQIFEVDHTFHMIIAKLPDHLIYRLRDEWKIAIQNPLPKFNARRDIAAISEGLRQALAPTKDQLKTNTLTELGKEIKPIFKLKTADALRKAFAKYAVLVRAYLCYFDWFPHHRTDLLKTVAIAWDGTFDTHIYYPCYGDKPDLYFKVQQDCHDGGWLTVYEPSIHCSTKWNYCCGTKINIQVSHPKASPGLSLTPCEFPYDTNDPAVMGATTVLNYDIPFNSTHAALLHTGEVLLLPGHKPGGDLISSTVWNPNLSGAASFTTPLPQDQVTDPLYCCHHAFLTDGRLLTIGGGGNYIANKIKSTWTFEPHAKKWKKVKDMKNKRWYPTAVTLPDGRVLAVSGSSVSEVEIYDPTNDTWNVVSGANRNFTGIYPSLHLLPSGEIFFSRTSWEPESGDKSSILTINGTGAATTGSWDDKYVMKYPDRQEGMAVILLRKHTIAAPQPGVSEPPPLNPPVPFARILVVGGGTSGTGNRQSVERIDLPPLTGTPAWNDADYLKFNRFNVNVVLLPDGTVLACGGFAGNTKGCEIYDPETNKWIEVAPLQKERRYHSFALLLPSGKVMISGGSDSVQLKIEIYSPPYLFRGPRPAYTIADSHFHHDALFSIHSPDACRIKKVGLMRPSAVTHHTDSEQRYIMLDFERKGKCELQIRAPKTGELAPPGHYMLFIVDDCGIPSEAKFVDLH